MRERVFDVVGATREKIDRLPPVLLDALERDHAPIHILRWIAWSVGGNRRLVRVEIALHVRWPSTHYPGRFRWLHDDEKPRAEALFARAVKLAIDDGRQTPRPNAIPLDVYKEAIGWKGPRKRADARPLRRRRVVPGEVLDLPKTLIRRLAIPSSHL